jgi:hypothetical protein
MNKGEVSIKIFSQGAGFTTSSFMKISPILLMLLVMILAYKHEKIISEACTKYWIFHDCFISQCE